MALAWKSFFWPKWVSSNQIPSLPQWLGWLEPGGARSLDCITTTCPPPLLPLWLSAGPSPILVTDQLASYSSGKSARKSDFVIWSWFTACHSFTLDFYDQSRYKNSSESVFQETIFYWRMWTPSLSWKFPATLFIESVPAKITPGWCSRLKIPAQYVFGSFGNLWLQSSMTATVTNNK